MASKWDSDPNWREQRDRFNADQYKSIEKSCKSYNMSPENWHKDKISVTDVIEYDKHGFIHVKDDSELRSWMEGFKLEKGESTQFGFGADKFSVTRTAAEGRFVVDEASLRYTNLDNKQRATASRASKTRDKTKRNKYYVEKTYDPSTGNYKHKIVKRKVDKKYRGGRKRILKESAGKEVIRKGFYAGKDILGEQMHKDDGQMKGTENFAKGSVRAFQAARSGAISFRDYQLKKNTQKAERLERKSQKLGYQLEARGQYEKEIAEKVGKGELSKNKAKRELQKEIVKNKYKRQAMLKYAQQQSSVVSFLTDSAARKKAVEQFSKAAAKYLLIAGVIVLLFGSLLGGCTAVFSSLFGGGSALLYSAYTAEHKEIEQAENYFNALEMKLVKAICNYESEMIAFYMEHRGADANGVFSDNGTEYHINVSYDLEAIGHSSTTLINYLTTLYYDFEFTENDLATSYIAREIEELFFQCYGIHAPGFDASAIGEDPLYDYTWNALNSISVVNILVDRSEQVPRRNPDGSVMIDPNTGDVVYETHEWKDWNIIIGGDYTFRSLEDVIAERLGNMDSSSIDSRYDLLCTTNGLLQQADDPFEFGDWRSRIQYHYGNYYTYVTSNFDGWNPFLYSPPPGESRAEAFRNYTSVYCVHAENIYAGMNGRVTAADGNSVTIRNSNSTTLSSNSITYAGLSTTNVTVNQTVSANQVIGSCNDVLYIYFMENGEYRNPEIYVR